MKVYSLSLEVHVYTWVNVTLNLAELNDLMFPKIHIFLFTEDTFYCAFTVIRR